MHDCSGRELLDRGDGEGRRLVGRGHDASVARLTAAFGIENGGAGDDEAAIIGSPFEYHLGRIIPLGEWDAS